MARALTKHQLMKLDILNKLATLNKIPRINNGGCGIVAYYLSQYIQEKYNKPSEIIYLLREDDYYSISKLRNNKPDTCDHAIVKVGRDYYDTQGSNTLAHYKRQWSTMPITIPPALAKRTIRSNYNWSSYFDRSNIPKIKSILNPRN